MSLLRSHSSKKPNPAAPGRAASSDAATGPSPDNRTEPPPRRYATESTPIMYRHLGKRTSGSSTDVRLGSSPPTQTSTPPLKPTANTSEARSRGMLMSPPISSGVFLSDLSAEPVSEISLGLTPVPDSLTEPWNMVTKNGSVNLDLNLRKSFGTFRMHGLRF